MTARTCIPVLAALLSLPALAQTTTVQPQPGTTTTVQSSPGSTTVQTQPPPPPPPPAPGTQVVVNPPPGEPPRAPATTARVGAYEPAVVVEEHHRAPMAIVATDALYGGIAGVLVGGGIALLDNGDHWQRDLMIGAGAGILAGVGVGIVQAVIESNDTPRTRAVADQIRHDGARSPGGPALAFGGHF